MRVFLVLYKKDFCISLDEDLNFSAPVLPDVLEKAEFQFLPAKLSKNDLLLFFAPFKTGGGVKDIIFAYFQVGKILKDKVYSAEHLFSDCEREGKGILSYSAKRVLTRYNSPENHFALPEFFRGLNVSVSGKNKNAHFRENGGVRYFENNFDCIALDVIPSRESGVFYTNALLEWTSSICENVRGKVTRRFSNEKIKGVGEGKTGFEKYFYTPDARGKIYCRKNHVICKKSTSLCQRCSLSKKEKGKSGCVWNLPLYSSRPYIPTTSKDAFAYFDALIEKGQVMDYRDE